MGEAGERGEIGDSGPIGPPGDPGKKGFPVSDGVNLICICHFIVCSVQNLSKQLFR